MLTKRRLTSDNSHRMKKLTTNNTTTSKWAEETKTAKEQLEFTEGTWRAKINWEKLNNQSSIWLVQGKIENESNDKSKVQHLLEGLTGWESKKKELVIWTNSSGTRPALSSKPEKECCQCKTTTETNTGTIPSEHVANLFWTQKHVLEDCDVLHLVGEYKIYKK